MYKHPAFVFLISLFLSACAGEDNSPDSGPYGTWRYIDSTSGSFLYISENYEELYTHHESHNCYTSTRKNFSSIDSNRFILESDSGFFDWSIQGDKLTLNYGDGLSSTLIKSTDNPDLAAICPDSIDLSVINVAIGFQKLPEAIYAGHYLNLFLRFDLNGNNAHDNGDISFVFLKFSDDETTPIGSLSANSREFIAQESEHRSTYFYLTRTQYSIENNAITFQIRKSEHEAFLNITAEANIHVKVLADDQNSVTQADYFPDYDTYTPSGTDLSNMLDNSDDVYSPTSEPILFDIEEVSLEFID